MALVQWKQISPHLSGSGNLTGSLNLLGDQTVSGDLVVGGRLTAQEFHTELTSASILYESGSSLFGNSFDDTHIFTGSVSITGSFSSKGPFNVEQISWPAVGEEIHLFKTKGYEIVFNEITRSYGYHGIALEHIENGSNNYHNSLTLYTFNSGSQDYGGEINIGPLRTHLRQYVSGSEHFANISVSELANGKSQALLYADEVQIGAYYGENILIGNSGSSIIASGSLRLSLNGVDQYFSVDIAGVPQVKVNEEGVLQVATKDVAPTPVTGGLFYSSSNEYYLGFI